ncbi:MAG: hypothetical protein WC997_15835 [Porticoccaceae bacterium]
MIVTFDTSADATEALRADSICKTIGRALVKHYPNRKWYVDVSIKGGVVKILCPSISMQFGFTLHLNKTAEELAKDAVRAGGQILEMFKLSREKGASGGEEALQRNARGDVIQAATGL